MRIVIIFSHNQVPQRKHCVVIRQPFLEEVIVVLEEQAGGQGSRRRRSGGCCGCGRAEVVIVAVSVRRSRHSLLRRRGDDGRIGRGSNDNNVVRRKHAAKESVVVVRGRRGEIKLLKLLGLLGRDDPPFSKQLEQEGNHNGHRQEGAFAKVPPWKSHETRRQFAGGGVFA